MPTLQDQFLASNQIDGSKARFQAGVLMQAHL